MIEDLYALERMTEGRFSAHETIADVDRGGSHIVAWWYEGRYFGINTFDFGYVGEQKHLNLYGSYSRWGNGWHRIVIPRFLKIAANHGCQAIGFESRRAIKRLIPAAKETREGYFVIEV